MSDDDEFWADLSYVQMSKNRTGVLQQLSKAELPLTPTELSARLEIAFNAASRAIRQLADHDLVTCINPEAPNYRRYRLTDYGRAVWTKVQKMNEQG